MNFNTTQFVELVLEKAHQNIKAAAQAVTTVPGLGAKIIDNIFEQQPVGRLLIVNLGEQDFEEGPAQALQLAIFICPFCALSSPLKIMA